MYAELGNAAAQQFIDMIELGAVVLGAMAVAVACQACMAVVAAASPEIPVLALGAAATTVGIGATRVGVGLTGDAKAARWGLGCLTHSFAPDTPVLMADGTTKRIDEIEIGDQVLTTDPETDATTTRPVTAIHRHRDTDLTDLTIVDDHGNQAILRTTQHHQIWDDTHHTWTDASQLRPGAALRTPTEAAVHVAGTANRTGTATMHDLTIADIHTYYVMAGETPVLVHNTGLTCETGRSLWQLTKDGASVMKRGGPFNTTFYKSASDGTWWTADTAGHGGSAFKVFEETKKGLQWIADADRYGNYISGKWKSSTGMFIPWSQLKGAG